MRWQGSVFLMAWVWWENSLSRLYTLFNFDCCKCKHRNPLSQECLSAKFILYWSFSPNISMRCLSASRHKDSYKSQGYWQKANLLAHMKRKKWCCKSMFILSWLALCKQYLHGGCVCVCVLASCSVQPPVASSLLPLPRALSWLLAGVFCSAFRNLVSFCWEFSLGSWGSKHLRGGDSPHCGMTLTWWRVTRAAAFWFLQFVPGQCCKQQHHLSE